MDAAEQRFIELPIRVGQLRLCDPNVVSPCEIIAAQLAVDPKVEVVLLLHKNSRHFHRFGSKGSGERLQESYDQRGLFGT